MCGGPIGRRGAQFWARSTVTLIGYLVDERVGLCALALMPVCQRLDDGPKLKGVKVSGMCDLSRSERDSEPGAEPGVAKSIVGFTMQRHFLFGGLADTAGPRSIDHLAAGRR